MKPICYLILCVCYLFFTTNDLKSQPIPLLKSENLWCVMEMGLRTPTPLISSYWQKLGSDTIIYDQKYHTVLFSPEKNHLNWESRDVFLREEAGKVYRYEGEGVKETLLYDFNLNEGDSIVFYENPKEQKGKVVSKIISVRQIQISDVIRKEFNIITYNDSKIREESWIEGVGSSWGPCRSIIYMKYTSVVSFLTCYHENDKLVFSHSGFSECYYDQSNASSNFKIKGQISDFSRFPNPSSGIFTIQTEVNNVISPVCIYDINGKLLKSVQTDSSGRLDVDMTGYSKGIYLIRVEQNGLLVTKKLIIK